ncbi:Ubiquitin-like-specific protease-like protein [Hapsidospora chrysogenum ATCC 11550]|uniref:Ubiquitin-like-specific protease-like protein n=1 Tax=Hapsidospora chrysogenum (strain ATCC 11550 / CBS 779.69 / DSM 880 / IAM 14645 / JCM 23072 / IMI 49137) TaxID=857340 RepID=A0A086T4D1_HAPC1|nr:Ubiquitin-like-specific protease-like protein [Hapsidospora chrysogenum ATCC 11550]
MASRPASVAPLRPIYTDSYNIAERRTCGEDGFVRNKRAKLSPPPASEVRWVTYRDPEFQSVERDAKQFSTIFDNVRETGNIVCYEASADAIAQLNETLEPLTLSLVDNSQELHAVRHDEWPDLAIMWLRGIRRITAYLGVMYHAPSLARLSTKYGERVPDIFNHNMGQAFGRNMEFTKRILSNPHFKRVFADVCTFWGLAYDGCPLSTDFLERVILDITAMENRFPPPSFVVSAAYCKMVQTSFSPPAWSPDHVSMSSDLLQDGRMVGQSSPRWDFDRQRYLSDDEAGEQTPYWTDIERRAEDQLRDQAAVRLTYKYARARRSDHGTREWDGARSDYTPRKTQTGRITKAARLRARFGATSRHEQRALSVNDGTASRRSPERQTKEDYEAKSPLDHRSTMTLRSILRARALKGAPERNTSPRLQQLRRRKSVRFADDVPSPSRRSHAGVDLPRMDDASCFARPEMNPPFSEPSSSNPSTAQSSSEPTPEPHVETETSPTVVEDVDVKGLRGDLEEMGFSENELPKVRRRYEPMKPPEQLTEAERRKRLMDLFSLPSPTGLRQSEDSKIAIRLRKEKEAAEAAEAKRKAEEKARKEAAERERREIEERLARSGGFRLPKKVFIAPLSAQWTQRAEHTLRAGATTNLATTGEGVDLRRHDFAKVVQPTEWLNDEIVNGSLNWLDRAINSAAGITNVKTQTRKCLALSSFFFKRLKDQGVGGTIRTLSRSGVKKDNLLDVDTILLPICENLHWTLLVIRPSKRTVAHMDSLNPRGNTANTNLGLAWMKEVLQEKFVADEWKVVRHEAPRQTNGWDCGVHTITNAMCIALGLSPIDCYSAEDMPLQRLRIAAVLLNGGFQGEFDLQVY